MCTYKSSIVIIQHIMVFCLRESHMASRKSRKLNLQQELLGTASIHYHTPYMTIPRLITVIPCNYTPIVDYYGMVWGCTLYHSNQLYHCTIP